MTRRKDFVMNKLLIGQFSKISGVSKRMLRHYEQKGLIAPSEIDHFTGYRYYSESQLQLIDNIRLLQSFGFTLSEIKSLMTKKLTAEHLVDALKDKEVVLRSNKDEIAGQLIRLQKSIKILSSDTTNHLLTLEELPLERNILMTNQTTLTQEAKALTLSLPSYSMFFEYIEEHVKTCKGEMYFLTFDIDNFLRINETFGFDAGDRTIFQMCKLIHMAFKDILDHNGQMARLGGDEFTLFIHDFDDLDLIISTSKLALSAIANFDFSTLGSDKLITSSCGLYHTDTFNNMSEFRHYSTKALLEAKRAGKNTLIVT